MRVGNPARTLQHTAHLARLRTADGAQRPKTDQADHDQVDGDHVIEKARKNQDKNPHDERHEG
jgi:hypothetical protein